MGEVLLRKYAKGQHEIISCGTKLSGPEQPLQELGPIVDNLIEAMKEEGIDVSNNVRNQLTPEMFEHIAMEHYMLQIKKSEESNKVLFVDSDATITRYYLDMYYKDHESPLIEEIIKLQNYDLAIFLEPDVKWVDDGLRFAGEDTVRKKNNELLKDMFKKRGIDFVCVDGDYNERFIKSKTLVDKLFEPKHN